MTKLPMWLAEVSSFRPKDEVVKALDVQFDLRLIVATCDRDCSDESRFRMERKKVPVEIGFQLWIEHLDFRFIRVYIDKGEVGKRGLESRTDRLDERLF